MALSDEEKRQLEALQQKASEPDDDDFDIEIWDSDGAGARLPYRKGKSWLQKFGIDLPETPEADDTGDGAGKAASKKRPQDQGQQQQGTAQRYFGTKAS